MEHIYPAEYYVSAYFYRQLNKSINWKQISNIDQNTIRIPMKENTFN